MMLEAIYYPDYVPDISWYKSQLLLWDNIVRIVPDSVSDRFGSSSLARHWGVPSEIVQSQGVNLPSRAYFNHRRGIIENQLLELAKNNASEYVDDFFHLNTEKVPKWVGEELMRLKLRKAKISTIWGKDHYLVRNDAADFLMSCVAHSMSQYQAMSPLTDKKINHFATFANTIGSRGSEKSSGENIQSVVSGVLNFMIPGNVEALSIEDILGIREEYGDMRKAVTNCINTISTEFKLETVTGETRANELVKESLNKFENEIVKWKKGSWRRMVKDWRYQSLATSFGITGAYLAGGSDIAIGMAFGSGAFSILNHIAGQQEESDYGKAVSYFSEINSQIDINEYVDGLIAYHKLVSRNV